MTLDGVLIKDMATGRTELRHRHCLGAGEIVAADSPSPDQPPSSLSPAYYRRKVREMVRCGLCGGAVPEA